MKHLLICFACVVLYRILKNASGFARATHYEKQYWKYLLSKECEFAQHTAAVTKLFEQACLIDPGVPFVQPAGHGYVAHGTASLFHNMSKLDEDIVKMMRDCFQKNERHISPTN